MRFFVTSCLNNRKLLLLSFLLGIALHSIFPTLKFETYIWIFVMAFFCLLYFIFFKQAQKIPRQVFLLIMILLFGIWRFDVAIPNAFAFQKDKMEFVGKITET